MKYAGIDFVSPTVFHYVIHISFVCKSWRCISVSVPSAKHVMKNNSCKNNFCSFIWTLIDFRIKNSKYTCQLSQMHFLLCKDNVINGIQKSFFLSVRPSSYGLMIPVVRGNALSATKTKGATSSFSRVSQDSIFNFGSGLGGGKLRLLLTIFS